MAKSDIILERMMSLHPKIIDLTLDRVWRLLDALGNPQDRLPPVIHIAGTNGKGSTLAMIHAGLEGAGLTCHAYTSPHLVRFHERIRVAGDLISEPTLTEILDRCYQANDGAPITYFEITTVAAILAFSETQADFTLLEVGLGGRLDATNVIEKPAITAITPVDMDHQQFLGDTLPEIAAEKAGIIKRNTLCVVGPQHDAALDVIEDRAMRLAAPLRVHNQHWHVYREHGRLVFQDEMGLLDLKLPVLPGPHQIQNAGIALAVLRELGKGNPDAAMERAEWPGRLQKITDGALKAIVPDAELWLDGGHNPAAGRALAQTLSAMPNRKTHIICGMLKTKDINGFLTPLRDLTSAMTAISIPGEANTLSADETAKAGQDAGFDAKTAHDIETALSDIQKTSPTARILICGSLYLAGHVLRKNEN
ncbi:bifunctional folylpolyglutamate synthase/dihydrofolate synthase [Pseudaestuariivita rosea]|uniref:bifunctional folylpolyglutamate synthase/dihydrofolate synthase n=1 Tax=Pseudaestuariivita rosea TaxID=2763263 RepID=UPI001F22B0E4|nr:folylpolyglutamate synthase/dihydrofolate synthase family protein [Pseudaestuariivita rosea]